MSISAMPTRPPHEHGPRHSHRSSRRPDDAITALADRIRAMHRVEPHLVGDHRTSILADLARVELDLERLSFDAWRDDHDGRRTSAVVAALAADLDRLSVHWPLEIEDGPS